MADLLDGFRPNMVDEDYFSQYFWWSPSKSGSSSEVQGDKNQGFDVLYHNMKHGQSSVKSLQEFIRESANTEDLYAKHLTKLAKQAANSSPLGTFAPMFEVFKEMTEKLSSCHMDVVHKLHDIIKDLSKYFEEQKGKQKQVKDGLSGTADSLHQIQTITVALQKSKEKYHQLCVEAERLKRNAAPSKEVDKADGKAKKASDDYKSMVEKYAKARNDYEQKMNDSAKRFQEIEVTHLKHMKSVLDTYIVSFENANVLMSQTRIFARNLTCDQHQAVERSRLLQVHQEFRRQVDENTIDSLIKRYCESKGTGTEKPAPIIFEECDVNSMLISVDPAHTNGTANDDAASQAPSKTSRRPLNLPFRRKRPRSKPSKENNTSDNKEPDKETESIESPDKDSGVKLDDEGYTIRPETPKESKSSWGLDSSDSDSDDPSRRKILVKINPKDKATSGSGENNLDALNAIIPNLTLNSPAPLGGKKLARRSSERHAVSGAPVVLRRRIGSQTEMDTFGSLERSSSSTSDIPNAIAGNIFSSTTPSKRYSDGVKVLPSLSETSPEKIRSSTPAPAQRCYGGKDLSKLSMRRKLHVTSPANRFSTAFVPNWNKRENNDRDSVASNDSYQNQDLRSAPFIVSENSGLSSDESQKCKSVENLAPTSDLFGLDVQPQAFRTPSHKATRPKVNSRGADKASGKAVGPASLVILRKPPGREESPKDGMKRQSDVTSVKSEKSVSDEIMELLGDTSAVSTSQTLQPSISNNNLDILSDFFGNKATSSIPNDNNKAVPQPSSRTSLVDKESDKEVGELTNLKSNGPSPLNSHNRPSSRPNNLLLPTNAWPETLKGTAPLASSESWSSLSSLGGATPMDSFASSRGPSPLTLSHGDPIPIAVAFTETVNAYFKGPSSDRCMAKICGEVQISFPAGIVRAFTSNPNPAVLRFCLKGNSNLQNLVPNKNLLCTDTTQPDSSQHLYWFDMAALTSHIKKMTDANPNAPYYNIQVLSYQMSSQSGHSIVPLHLKSHWRCESDSTEIIVDYKYNNAVTSSPLKNIQVLVPVDGGVIDSNSTPSAIWIAAQNRLVWKLPSSISSTAPTGTLKAKLSLTAGPSKSTSLAVQFVSEGSTLTGSDFELTDSGYRVSLVKKRFTSGKYLLDRN